ncbi:MAG: aspartate kinase [Lachnospiraceae bacterium]|uniref:aspartate kinase n=1 Tax=Parablautia sp. Marseille-Q6255 TaxID=3039593 RepID=UPI0024BC0A85|nr:aspartate kinase [Parablautia sp. Marseille-Q6255]
MGKEQTIVAKFGGSSLADAGQFKKVKDILRRNPDRRYIVPSAPGKRDRSDEKVTDLLYECYGRASRKEEYRPVLDKIKARYQEIIDELELSVSLDKEFQMMEQAFISGAGEKYAASRGEYLNGILLAAFLGYEFVDAAEVIRFDRNGNFEDERTNFFLADRLVNIERAVIPGFYGADDAGNIHTFSRGGSDVTGALVARAVCADLYENWTDVSGFLLTDPGIVDHPKKIDIMTYSELRELSYRGATVLHEEAVFPVRREGISIHIRNTNHPEEKGTLICSRIDPEDEVPITGIAGKRNFVAVSIAKNRMNAQVGFCKRLLEAFDENHIVFEHMPSGIDTICVILPRDVYQEKREAVMASLERLLAPDKISVDEDMALVTVVGKGMRSVSGIAAKFFTALGEAGVNIKMIDMGSNEINCTVGVSNQDFEKAIRALYDALAV